MDIGPFFVGQVPADPLVITIRDSATNNAKGLSSYTAASLILVNPEGTSVATSGGSTSLSDVSGGVISYNWPTTSLFGSPGDYKFQVKLTGDSGITDYTIPQTFEVKARLV